MEIHPCSSRHFMFPAMVTAIGMEAITGDIAKDTHFITVTTTGPTGRAGAATVATGVMVEMPDGVGMADIEVDRTLTIKIG
jgi:hypothetical protein